MRSKNSRIFYFVVGGIIVLVSCKYYTNWIGEYHKYRLEQGRKQKYDEAEKLGKVLGIKFPKFKTVLFEESFKPSDILPKYICKSTAEFLEVPSQSFYEILDSVCSVDSVKWRKYDGVYIFDSIYGNKTLSKLELSLIVVKGEKEFKIEYDDTPNFKLRLLKDIY